MKDIVIQYITELSKMEKNVHKLYYSFSEIFQNKKDKDFWYDISIEELNHSSLLISSIDFYEIGALPDYFIKVDDLTDIQELNDNFHIFFDKFADNPTVENAIEIAKEIESSAGEIHYQKIMESEKNDKILNVFKQLNKEDMDHLDRILKYSKSRI